MLNANIDNMPQNYGFHQRAELLCQQNFLTEHKKYGLRACKTRFLNNSSLVPGPWRHQYHLLDWSPFCHHPPPQELSKQVPFVSKEKCLPN